MKYLTAKRLLLIVLTILVLSFIGCAFRDHTISTGFERIDVGATKDDVLRTMGSPSEKGRCGLVIGLRYADANCIEEFVYRDPFFPIPDGYSILFDASGHVTSKYYYSSP